MSFDSSDSGPSRLQISRGGFSSLSAAASSATLLFSIIFFVILRMPNCGEYAHCVQTTATSASQCFRCYRRCRRHFISHPKIVVFVQSSVECRHNWHTADSLSVFVASAQSIWNIFSSQISSDKTARNRIELMRCSWQIPPATDVRHQSPFTFAPDGSARVRGR